LIKEFFNHLEAILNYFMELIFRRKIRTIVKNLFILFFIKINLIKTMFYV